MAREKTVFKNSHDSGSFSLWMPIKDILLRTMNDDASRLQMHRKAIDKSTTQFHPPYTKSVLYAFLKDTPKSQTILLLQKVKGHIVSTTTQYDTCRAQNRACRE